MCEDHKSEHDTRTICNRNKAIIFVKATVIKEGEGEDEGNNIEILISFPLDLNIHL